MQRSEFTMWNVDMSNEHFNSTLQQLVTAVQVCGGARVLYHDMTHDIEQHILPTFIACIIYSQWNEMQCSIDYLLAIRDKAKSANMHNKIVII